jgi:GMP synthase-like glutamine amidotransferase
LSDATRPGRLWVIDPSIHHAEDQGVEQVLRGWRGESRIFRPSLPPEDGPRAGDGYDAAGVVLLGSGASVHEDLPWLRELSGWLRPLLDGSRELPLLGICFGHQLIAHLAGAEVGDLHEDGSKELGARETRVDGWTLLPGRHDLKVVVSHREEVKTVPEGYRVVARRPGVPLDGLEHERLPISTFQFHPEARDEFVSCQGLAPSAIDARLVEDSDRVLEAFRRRVLA